MPDSVDDLFQTPVQRGRPFQHQHSPEFLKAYRERLEQIIERAADGHYKLPSYAAIADHVTEHLGKPVTKSSTRIHIQRLQKGQEPWPKP